MKNFHCDVCDKLVYFENFQCGSCGHALAFIPSTRAVTAIAPVDDGLWVPAGPQGNSGPLDGPRFRKCQNFEKENVCNWLLEADDPGPFCSSCRLTETIPDLSQPGHREGWAKLETAKRRLIYSLLEMKLPVQGKAEVPGGLMFRFMADDPKAKDGAGRVLTGHDNGTIVINVAEADDAERERRRLQLHEPYRTLLGHLRHEVGHYYWEVLIRDSERLDAYRELFGDETADYAEALKKHYESGAPANWGESFVSVYAASHPWEDWAETWAHYMHISDTLETADVSGLRLKPSHRNEPAMPAGRSPENPAARDFDEIVERWIPLTHLLNNLNRGLGLVDAYPFVLSAPVISKLRFVHDTIRSVD